MTKVRSRILKRLNTVRIHAQPVFITSEKYFKKAGVNWMGCNFTSQFVDLEVEATEAVELIVSKLKNGSTDTLIIKELGAKAELSVSKFRAFIKNSRKGLASFIFFLRGKDGNLWVVSADWDSVYGWSVDAGSVGHPIGWFDGSQVVSQV